jgi:hypothetical protein
MKVVFLFLFVILFTLHIQAQNASLFNKFIPKGYQLLDSKSGDINQDGITDYIIICKSPNEDQKEMKDPFLSFMEMQMVNYLSLKEMIISCCAIYVVV